MVSLYQYIQLIGQYVDIICHYLIDLGRVVANVVEVNFSKHHFSHLLIVFYHTLQEMSIVNVAQSFA